MKIRYIHEIEREGIKIGDEMEVSERVGRARIAGNYAVDITEMPKPKVTLVKVKYLQEVTSPPAQVGKIGDVKDLDVVIAKHLIEDGFVRKVEEKAKKEKGKDK